MSNDLFTNKPQTTTEVIDYKAAMSQKFNKDGQLDVDGLAKGKFEADEHIKNIEAEMAELRRELETRISLQTFLDQQKNSQNTPPVSSSVPTSQNQNAPKGNEPTPLSKDDIAEYVKNAIIQEKTALTREQNIDYTVSELTKMFGANYVDKLTKVSQDLGVGKDFLNNLAAEQPKAFLKLVSDSASVAKPQAGNYTPPRSVVNTTPVTQQQGTTKNWTYYQTLKKNDPKAYFDARTQAEMHREAIRQSEAFYQ